MIFDKIQGHQNQVQSLKNVLKSFKDLPSRALLFSGPSGVGKKLVALGWAQGLLCKESVKPCGKCSSCIRIESGNHPDLLQIKLQDSPTIKIEQIREIQSFVSLQSFEGQGKVIIIDDAQAMTGQASNSLLKTLEEPNPHCNFVLITSNRAGILPTIQSRCQKILFGALQIKDLKKILPDSETWALELAQGRLDLVSKFSDPDFKKLKTQALRVLRDLTKVRIFEGFTSLAPLSEERESSLFTVQCWARWVTLATALKLGVKLNLDTEERPVLEGIASECTSKALLSLGEKILRLEQDIQSNINKSLAFEKFWLDANRQMPI